MKLFYCPSCHDIVKLTHFRRSCMCGKSWGYYRNNLDVVITCNTVPIGIGSRSFREAIANQPRFGNGKEFTAFVIPARCETVAYFECLQDDKKGQINVTGYN